MRKQRNCAESDVNFIVLVVFKLLTGKIETNVETNVVKSVHDCLTPKFGVRQSCTLFTGYDKLKPFGFPIHAAVDGYSRKVIWLETERSNNLKLLQVIT